MKYLRIINLATAIVTILLASLLIIAPAFVLKALGAETTPTTCQLFATIGMLMLMFGGLLLHALYSVRQNNAAILWAALQKFGSSVAVFIGIYHRLYLPVAAFVASLDFISFIPLIIYYRNITRLN